MATTHIDYRKIDYDQLLDKPIIRTDASVDTLTTAGVYDKGDGKRYIVSVNGQNITQVIEEKDGYQTRSSTDGGTTWGAWETVVFSKSGDIDAEDVNYDNTTSGLIATNVQAAIDEMNTVVEEIKDIVEVEEMPTPSEDVEGTIIQYKGSTTSDFTHGYFYECVGDGQNPETFSRVRIDVQPNNAAASSVSYDNTTSGMTATNVQDAIDEIDTSVDTINTTITNIQSDITDIKNIVEVETMDTPSEDNEGSIVQYKGATNANFTHGYFYECVGDGGNPESFARERIDVQPAGAGDEHEFITQTAYDLLTPAQKAAKVYMIKEEGVPGSGLIAGAGIDITNNVISADMSTAVYDNTTSGATATNMQDAMDEVFQSVSNGKELLADAITDKGVQTSANDSFSTMATNIGLIQTASDYDAFITKTYIKNNFFRNESGYGISTSLTGDFLNSDKSKYYRYFVVTSSLSSGARYHLGLATKTENDDFVVTVGDSFLSADSVIDIYENRKKIVGNDVSYSLFFGIRNVHQSPVYETYYYITATNTTVGTPVNMGNSTYTTYESAYEQRDTNCGISSAENIADINRTTLSTAVSSNYYYNLTINVL